MLLKATQIAPAEYELPPGTKVAHMEDWKEELRRRGALDPDHSNPSQQFKRLWQQLAGRQLIGRRDEIGVEGLTNITPLKRGVIVS